METVLPLILGAGLALVMHVVWSRQLRTRALRALRQMTNVSIADVKDGAPARITGMVSVLDETLKTPVGQRACVGFRLEVERIDGARRTTVLRRQECRAFAVADESGQAVIEGRVLLGLQWKHDWSVLPESWYGMLEAAGVVTEGLFFRRRFAFRQAALEPGDRITACGIAFFEPDPSAPAVGLRAPALRPHFRGTKSQPVALAEAADPAPPQELDEAG